MLALFNSGSDSSVLKIREIWIKNVQVTTITGVTASFELRRFTGMSATGSFVTPQTYDTNDVLSSNVTSSTGGTITGEGSSSMFRWIWSSTNWGASAQSQPGSEHIIQNTSPAWIRRDEKEKAITLRSNQGIHIKDTVNSTAGTFDLTIVFTQV